MKKIIKIISLNLIAFNLASAAMANNANSEANFPKKGNNVLTIFGGYVNKGTNDSVGTPGNLGLTKRSGFGLGAEFSYFLRDEISLSTSVSYQRFGRQGNPLTLGASPGSDGARPVGTIARFVPIRIGLNFHLRNLEGSFCPFVGGGYEYVLSNYKSNLAPVSVNGTLSSTQLSKSGRNGVYAQAGFNFLVDEDINMQLKLSKSFRTRKGAYDFSIGGTGDVFKTVRSSPLEVSIGFSMKLDN